MFKVEKCLKCSDDRQFKTGQCVYNNNLGMCYSVEEIVEVLNNNNFQSLFFELIQYKIWYSQKKFMETKDKNYKMEEEILKVLRMEVCDIEKNIDYYKRQIE